MLIPDDYRVVVGHSLGVAGQEQIIEVPLHELDHVKGYGNLSLVWVPRSEQEELTIVHLADCMRLFRFYAVRKAAHGIGSRHTQSLRKNLIEEAYEVLETIDEDDPEHMCEELGDLLLQVMLHAQMEEEIGTFTVYDVIATLNEKLIRRHPHVFGEQ